MNTSVVLKIFSIQFPSKEKLYSLLMDKKISDNDYEHVLKVRNTFKMKKKKKRLSQPVLKM